MTLPDCTLEPAELLLVSAGAALKQVISWTLLAPPVPAEKPKRRLEGNGPLEAVMSSALTTDVAAPPLMLYEKSSLPAEVIRSEYVMGVAAARVGTFRPWCSSPAGWRSSPRRRSSAR